MHSPVSDGYKSLVNQMYELSEFTDYPQHDVSGVRSSVRILRLNNLKSLSNKVMARSVPNDPGLQ